MSEVDQDKLGRLRLMASGDDKWDLSDKDQAAIDWIIRRVDDLTKHVEDLTATLAVIHTLRPADEYHEDHGVVLWWHLPVQEPPHVGSGQGMDERNPDGTRTTCCRLQRCGWLTHWSPLPDTRRMTVSDGKKVGDE
jgi:hypothetical protein